MKNNYYNPDKYDKCIKYSIVTAKIVVYPLNYSFMYGNMTYRHDGIISG